MPLVMMVFPGRLQFNVAHVAFNAGLIGLGHTGLWAIRGGLVADLPLTHDALEEGIDRVHAATCQPMFRRGRYVSQQKRMPFRARRNHLSK